MAAFRPTISVDFDGVIHKYSRGWADGSIYDDAVPGFFEWASETGQWCELVVYSSRSKDQTGIDAMMAWVAEQTRRWKATDPLRPDGSPWPDFCLDFAAHKPAAWVTIDDRAIGFNGSWSDLALTADALLAFAPWNKRPLSAAQRLMARAALGLPSADGTSIRNRYVVPLVSPAHEDWMTLVARGMAFRIDARLTDHGGSDLFRLTPEGARTVLEPGETLAAADFGKAA